MTVSNSDLFRAFRAGATRNHAGISILDGTGQRAYMSFEDLLAQAEEKAVALASRGFVPQDRLALFARTSFDFLIGAIACWRLGAVVVPLPFPPRFLSQDSWIRESSARVMQAGVKAILVGDDDSDPDFDGPPRVPISALTGSTYIDLAFADQDAPAMIQFTSGSTAQPRGVVVSHRSLVTQCENLLEAVDGGQPDSHLVSWLPLYHDLGLVGTLMTIMVSGDPITLMPPEAFVLDPGLWILEISRNRADVSAAPAFAYGMAARAIEKGLPEPIDLSCWDRAASGGETINPKPIRRFFDSAVPFGFDPAAFCAGYGLAEAACVTTVVRPGEGLRIDSVDRRSVLDGFALETKAEEAKTAHFVSCGRAIPGVAIKILGREGMLETDRVIGEVCVSGPTVMQGYLDEPEATARVIQDGWLRTGDIGYLVDGELYVTGRAKDVIIVRGQNYSPEDLERVVEEVPGTHWGSTIAIGVRTEDTESVLLAVETKITVADDLRRLRSAIQKRLASETGIHAGQVVLLAPHSLPRTSSGKLQRNALREMYEAGELQGIDLLDTTATVDG